MNNQSDKMIHEQLVIPDLKKHEILQNNKGDVNMKIDPREYEQESIETSKHYHVNNDESVEEVDEEIEELDEEEMDEEDIVPEYTEAEDSDVEIFDEKVTDIRKTNDYSKFKNIMGNRDLRGTNYNRLIQSMQKKQLIIPILVNSDFEIIDGQHRFEVCRRLSLPLYYYIIDGYGIDEVKRANLVGCNWVIDDYLKLNVEIGKKNYIEFKRIKDAYGLTTSQLLDIFANFQGISLKEIRMLFEDGSFELDSVNKVVEFLNKLEDFNVFDEYNSYSFTKAFLKLNSLEQYDHSIMKKRIKKHPYKLAKRASYRDYISLLVEMYNFGATNIRFGYDSVQDMFYLTTTK